MFINISLKVSRLIKFTLEIEESGNCIDLINNAMYILLCQMIAPSAEPTYLYETTVENSYIFGICPYICAKWITCQICYIMTSSLAFIEPGHLNVTLSEEKNHNATCPVIRRCQYRQYWYNADFVVRIRATQLVISHPNSTWYILWGRFDIKILTYWCTDSLYKDKTVSRPCYLYNENPSTWQNG